MTHSFPFMAKRGLNPPPLHLRISDLTPHFPQLRSGMWTNGPQLLTQMLKFG